jgi:ABC-type antimicrobial peptide transport system permease subunit
MTRLVDDALLPRSTAAGVLGVFSVVALVLAVIGVYGVISYGVTQQMAEFGVRLALGATPRQLAVSVMRRSAWTLLAGAAIGIAGAAALSGVMASLLYGLHGLDPATYAGASGVLITLGLLVCLVPAWRVASARPLAALRIE